MLHLKKFWFKKFLTLHVVFPKNDFNFVTQNFAKKWKMFRTFVFDLKVTLREFRRNFFTQNFAKRWKILFPNSQNIRFSHQGSFKTKLQEASCEKISISKVFHTSPCFPKKRFQLRHSKLYEKLKNAIFNRSEHSFLPSR